MVLVRWEGREAFSSHGWTEDTSVETLIVGDADFSFPEKNDIWKSWPNERSACGAMLPALGHDQNVF